MKCILPPEIYCEKSPFVTFSLVNSYEIFFHGMADVCCFGSVRTSCFVLMFVLCNMKAFVTGDNLSYKNNNCFCFNLSKEFKKNMIFLFIVGKGNLYEKPSYRKNIHGSTMHLISLCFKLFLVTNWCFHSAAVLLEFIRKKDISIE